MSDMKSAEAPGHTKTYSIIVNGRPREVSDHKLTYLQVVQLAYHGEVPTETIVFWLHTLTRMDTMVPLPKGNSWLLRTG